jgi:hypothetical protein
MLRQDKEKTRIGVAVLKFLEDFVPCLLTSLQDNEEHVREILAGVRQSTEGGRLGGATMLAQKVSLDLQKEVGVLFSPRFRLVPPSVEFGGMEQVIRVSPTAGGTDNPDAFGQVGIQIDVNPTGEGNLPIGRLTVGVDVDSDGKVRGASVGWKCRF